MTNATHAKKLITKLRGKPRIVRKRRRRQTLRLSPWAWAKLVYLRDAGPTEIGGFGISHAEDLLLVQDVRLVTQRAAVASIELDDAAVADFFDEQVERGRRPEQFGRVWVHTHPGDSAEPSATDEATFTRVFGPCDWAVMLIVAAGGATYARLRFSAGPGGELKLPVEVCYEVPFPGSDEATWDAEYLSCVQAATTPEPALASSLWPESALESPAYRYDDYYRELEGRYAY